MSAVADLLALLEGFTPDPTPRAEASLRQTVGLVRTVATPFRRDWFVPGHLTASGVVLSPGLDRVLLIWHERLGRWLQPGGHFEEGDAHALAAARREVVEETGLQLATDGVLVGVDVHEIPPARGEPAHLHHDLVFGFHVPVIPKDLRAETRLEWCALEDLELRGADDPLRRAAARARMAYSM